MASYSLRIKRTAIKELEAIPTKADRRRIVKRIESLADNPRPPGARKLSGHERYRIRHGRYRILYSINDRELIVHVIRIGHRKDIYRNVQ
ncbi:MAG: type II toxin-antitoxin system RelE family toxin [Woeseiaceae bacterium]